MTAQRINDWIVDFDIDAGSLLLAGLIAWALYESWKK